MEGDVRTAERDGRPASGEDGAGAAAPVQVTLPDVGPETGSAAGETPANGSTAGEAPAQVAPAGQAPANSAPAGETPANGSPAVEVPANGAPAGQAPARAPWAPEPRRRARVIAMANQKGGVGKTTTTISLGAALAELGHKILVVDFDPQGGCALGLGIEPGALELSVYNALLDRSCRSEDVVLETSVEGMDLLPSNIDLSAAELMLVQEVAREQSLSRALAPLRRSYDFILVDCPPSLGLLTINALTAADGVIVPLECEYYALRGMGLLMDSIERVRDRLNPELEIDGIVATMYDGRTLHAREVLERVREAFGDALFDSIIRKTIRFAEAPVAGEPILKYAPTSTGSASYRALAKEVISRVSTRQPAGS